jgi:hypothetical protein
MNHHAPVNLRDVDLNSVLRVVTMDVQKMVVRLMIHLMMGDQSYLVYLNYRDALPCTHSLITFEI